MWLYVVTPFIIRMLLSGGKNSSLEISAKGRNRAPRIVSIKDRVGGDLVGVLQQAINF